MQPVFESTNFDAWTYKWWILVTIAQSNLQNYENQMVASIEMACNLKTYHYI